MKKRQKNSAGAFALRITLATGLILTGAILPASLSQLNAEAGPRKKLQPPQAGSTWLFAKLAPGAARASLPPRELTLADRSAYQYAIEDIYWRHRIWPKQNKGPKPSLDEVMSPGQIEQKVETYLRDSQLLADEWHRPITPEQLQAEMNRMASHSRQPEVLQGIFNALGNDPALIAECLARPVLSERLVRQLYAHDESLHGALKQRAESDLRAHPSVSGMKQTSGTYSEMEWIKSADSDSAPADGESVGTVRMSGSEWNESVEKLAAMFATANPSAGGGGPGAPITQIKTGVLSSLQEDNSHYYATAVLEKGKDRLKVATIAWKKEPFEAWAATAEEQPRQTATELTAGYTLPQITSSSTGCTPDTWVATSTTNAPDARDGHTAVWTGSEMIVWGGLGSSSLLNSGGRYDPSTDSWITTSTINAPSTRYRHTAVWTGSEMIVWGGYNSITDVSSGGRYNPSTDSWVATTTTTLDGRELHTAVWTGSEMIVWGGYNGAWLNSGGRYDPGTDSWVAITTSNAPAARDDHTAVWTGSEMIVWGGYNGSSSRLNSGGRYDPGADSWVATSTTDAPVGRFLHTGVWTGSEMIVWGGAGSGSSVLNSGGRYDPGTDSWITTTTNAPAQRYRHTAVWTGSEMIVWGGYNNRTGYLNTGGRYNPSTNSWVATSTTNAPAARYFHTAVWTGSEMIVWGGGNDSGYFNSGGRYCVQPGPIVLSTQGRKVGGINTVRLTWSGATSNRVDIYRNGALIVRTRNDGSYIDSTGDTGRARYIYQVCEAGTMTCSDDAIVRFQH